MSTKIITQDPDPQPEIILCRAGDLPENTAKGFVIDTDNGRRHLFVLKKAGQFHAYENRCPHTGVNLDWQPDKFLDTSGSLIQCSTHGALFRIEDGRCIQGPCVNQSLTRIPVYVKEGDLRIKVRPAVPAPGTR